MIIIIDLGMYKTKINYLRCLGLHHVIYLWNSGWLIDSSCAFLRFTQFFRLQRWSNFTKTFIYLCNNTRINCKLRETALYLDKILAPFRIFLTTKLLKFKWSHCQGNQEFILFFLWIWNLEVGRYALCGKITKLYKR